MDNGLGGFSMTTTVFAAGLVVALLAGLFVGAGGGLAIIAVVLLAAAIVWARSEQALAASQTSAVFNPSGPGKQTSRTLDSDLPPPASSAPAAAEVTNVSDQRGE